MSKLPKQSNTENVVVGFDTADDAGVFRLSDSLCLVQTVDFFTPVADDPFIFGKIAAVNSLNDVYAMGGKPLTALSVVGYPQKGDWNVLSEILRGGQETLNEHGVTVIGGHSIDDAEIKFGYCVTGIIDIKDIKRNSTAAEGDVLILTKPIGTGVISTGIKFGKADEKTVAAALNVMTESAASASKAMVSANASACTDVTGFGLLGHAFEMANGSRKTLHINADEVPLLPNVLPLIGEKMLTRGDKNNRAYVGEEIEFGANVGAAMQSALFDPQTAGGLLISIARENAAGLLSLLPNAKIIGKVENYDGKCLRVD